MKFRVKPTRVQWVMIACMAVVYTALIVFLFPEIAGIISPEAEDTLSEWVFDLPTWANYTIGTLFIVTGIPFIWAGGHFIEGRIRRRNIEQGKLERPSTEFVNWSPEEFPEPDTDEDK